MTSGKGGIVLALIKIFDEILVNASNNHFRNSDTCIDVSIEIDNKVPKFSIYNNGCMLPNNSMFRKKETPISIRKNLTHDRSRYGWVAYQGINY